MSEIDRNYIDDLRKMDPAYKMTKEFLAAAGVDFDTWQSIEPRPMNVSPEVASELGFGIAKPQAPISEQYPEAIGPEPRTRFNEFGQPGADLGLYRRASNWLARGAGSVASRLTRGIGGEAGREKAREMGEGFVRSVLTQGPAAATEFPQLIARMHEDAQGQSAMMAADAAEFLAQEAIKNNDPEAARRLTEQVQDLRNPDPNAFSLADKLTDWNKMWVNPPTTDGERAMRDGLGILIAMLATRKVGPTAAKGSTSLKALESGKVAEVTTKGASHLTKMLEGAARGGITDYVLSDPTRAGAMEGILEAVDPDLADSWRNYVSGGGSERQKELRLHFARRTGEAGIGLAFGGVIDGLMIAAKSQRFSKLFTKMREAQDTVVDPAQQQAAVATFLDELIDEIEEPAMRDQLTQLKSAPLEVQLKAVDDMMEASPDVSQLGTQINRQAREERIAGFKPAISTPEGYRTPEGLPVEAKTETAVPGFTQRVSTPEGYRAPEGLPVEVKTETPVPSFNQQISTPEGYRAPEGLPAEAAAETPVPGFTQRVSTPEGYRTPEGLPKSEVPGFRPEVSTPEGYRAPNVSEAAVPGFSPTPFTPQGYRAPVELPDFRLEPEEIENAESLVDDLVADLDDARPVTQGISEADEAARAKVLAVANEPTHEQYPEVVKALGQSDEQTAVEIGMRMNPFPASKVVDEQGNNLPLFHGSTRAFDEMSDDLLGTGAGTNRYGKGHHFSDAELAGEYASKGEGGNIRKAYVDIQNPIDMDAPVSDEMMQILEAEGRAMDVDPDDAMKDVYDRWVQDLTDEQGMEIGAAKDYISGKFQAAGFDGLTYKFGDMGGGKDHTVWVAFHSNQVVNAFGGLEGAVEQLMKAVNPPAAAKAPSARKPRGQGKGTVQAQRVVERMEREEIGADVALHTVSRVAHLNDKKAAELLLKTAHAMRSPIVQSIANHPEIQKLLGGAALTVAVMWGMKNLDFGSDPNMDEAMAEVGNLKSVSAGLPLDDVLKAIIKHNASKAAGAATKEAAKVAAEEVIPRVAKEAAESVKFVKSLPVEKFSDDVIEQLRRVESGGDVEKILDKTAAKSYSHLSTGDTPRAARLQELREKLGYNEKVLNLVSEQGKLNEQRLEAGIDLAKQTAADVKQLASGALAGEAGAQKKMLKQLDVLGSILDRAIGQGATMGRPFRLLAAGPEGSVKILRKAGAKAGLFAAKSDTTATLADLTRIVMNTSDDDLMKMMNRMNDPSWNGALREMYYNNMLSRVKTQAKNIIGNSFNIGVNVMERYAQAGFSAIKGNRNTSFEDANNLVKGYWHGFREALGKFAPAYHGVVDERWAGKFPLDEVRQGDMEVMLGSKFGKAAGWIGKHYATPTKVLQGSDSFFKEWTYFAELYSEAQKRASLAGENAEDWFKQLYYDPPTELTEAARARAANQGLVLTHTADLWDKWSETGGTQAFQQLGRMGDALNQAKHNSWLLTLTTPFVKTSTNALRFNLERFPIVNMLDKQVRDALMGRMGSEAQELALAKTTVAGTIMGGFALMAANMELTGSAPRDPELRATWLAAHPEYSVNFGGTWVSYDPKSTLGLMLAAAANIGQAIGGGTGVEFDSKAEAAAWAASLSFGVLMESAPVFEPIGTLVDMMGTGDYPSDEKLQNPMLRQLFRYGTQAAVPGLAQDIKQLIDPVQKDLKDMDDFVMSHMPGWGAEANLDAFGRVRSTGYGFGNQIIPNTVRFLTGYSVRPDQLDPVDQELLRLGIGVREPSRVRGVDLNAKQRNEILRVAGPQAHAEVKEFIESDLYNDLNDNGRQQLIKRIIYNNYEIASAHMMANDENLLDRIIETSLEKRNIMP